MTFIPAVGCFLPSKKKLRKKKEREELFENESIFFLCTSFLSLNDLFVFSALFKPYDDDDDGDCMYLQC